MPFQVSPDHEALIGKERYEIENSKATAIRGPRSNLANSLPFDILGEIFQYCVPSASSWEAIGRPYVSEVPLLLCRICSHWRAAALSMHGLWKELSIEKIPFTVQDGLTLVPTSTTKLLLNWFGRSGELPLRLRLVFDDADGVDVSPMDHTSVAKIFSSRPGNRVANRIQYLEIISEYANGVDVEITGTSFPNLHSLVLWSNRGGGRDTGPIGVAIIAPLLRRVFLHSYLQLPWRFITQLVPFSQLTHLVSECLISYVRWHEILQGCTNLEEGMFHLFGGDWSRQETSDLTVPSLIHLTTFLHYNSPVPSVSDIFGGLQFPSLTHLQISSLSSSIPVGGWHSVLNKTPSLNHLHVGPHLTIIDYDLYRAIDDHNPLLDSLIICQPLEVDFDFIYFSPNSLADFVRERTLPSTPIKQLALGLPSAELNTFWKLWVTDINNLLQSMVDDGLKLTVKNEGIPLRSIPSIDPVQNAWYLGVRGEMFEEYAIMRM